MESGLTYISDPDEVVISRYGLRDTTLGAATARPASFILDRQGRVAWRHLPSDWRIRADQSDYMSAFGDIMRRGYEQ